MDPITSDLLELMPDEVGVEAPISESETGVVTYGTLATYRARVSGKVRNVIGADGQEHVSTVQATFASAPGLTIRHRFTLPARFSSNPADPSDLFSRQPSPIAVNHQTDENGPHHEVVYF